MYYANRTQKTDTYLRQKLTNFDAEYHNVLKHHRVYQPWMNIGQWSQVRFFRFNRNMYGESGIENPTVLTVLHASNVVSTQLILPYYLPTCRAFFCFFFPLLTESFLELSSSYLYVQFHGSSRFQYGIIPIAKPFVELILFNRAFVSRHSISTT